MTLSTTVSRVSYTGNGVTTAFAFPYKFNANVDLKVILRNDTTFVETVQVITTNYTVSGAGNDAGGTVTMVTAPTASESLTIYRDPSQVQETDFVENDPFPAETHEDALDLLTMLVQRLSNRLDRALTLSEGNTDTFSPVLPADVATADSVFKVNSAGTGLELAELDSLDAFAFPAGNGILVKTAVATAVARTITGTSNEITVTNGDGVSGNPTISMPAGAVTTAKLNDGVFNGLTSVTPVAADAVAIADASDSGNKKKASVSAFRNAVYRSVTTTDSVGVDDETMKLSGASFTSTLPTAVGVAGKRYKFLHAGTSLTQLYTLATTSSQTIGGIAGGSYILQTNGEVLEIESDGANWIIVGRHTSTAWTSFTPTGAWSTNCTYTGLYRRIGDSAEVMVNIALAGAPTSATLTINTPSGITIDTAKILDTGGGDTPLGSAHLVDGGNQYTGETTYNTSTTVLIMYDNPDDANNRSALSSVTQAVPFTFGSGDSVAVVYKIPVSGWQP